MFFAFGPNYNFLHLSFKQFVSTWKIKLCTVGKLSNVSLATRKYSSKRCLQRTTYGRLQDRWNCQKGTGHHRTPIFLTILSRSADKPPDAQPRNTSAATMLDD